MIFTPNIIEIVSPKLIEIEGETTILVARITIFYILFSLVITILSILLQINYIFYPIGIVTIIFNTILLLSLYLSYKFNFLSIYILSLAIIVAGLIQIVYLIFFLKKIKLIIFKKFSFKQSYIYAFLYLFLPAIIIYGTFSILKLASYIFSNNTIGHASYFYYADRLFEIPTNVISLSISIILLPFFTKLMQENKRDELINIVKKSIRLLFITVLPVVVLMFCIPEFIVSILFERGLFNKDSTKSTALILQTLSLAIIPNCIIIVLLLIFFIQKNTKPLLYISLVIIIFHLMNLFYLNNSFLLIGSSVAIVLSFWLYLFCLIWILQKKMKIIDIDFTYILGKYILINLFLVIYFYYFKEVILDKKFLYNFFIFFVSILIYLFYLTIFDKIFVKDIISKIFKTNDI